MFKIDCSVLPAAVTDFTFDHLHDDFQSPISEKIDIDYNEQVVFVDVGNLDDAYSVRDKIQERAYEEINDLLFETKRGYDTGFEVNELNSVQSTVEKVSVKIE